MRGLILALVSLFIITGCQHMAQESKDVRPEGCVKAEQIVAFEQMRMIDEDPTVVLNMEFCKLIDDEKGTVALALVSADRVNDNRKTQDEFAAIFHKNDDLTWSLVGVKELYLEWDMGPAGVQNPDAAQSVELPQTEETPRPDAE